METVKLMILSQSFESDGKRKLTCTNAHTIAEKSGTSLSLVGKICDEENIRICKCQLKCF